MGVVTFFEVRVPRLCFWQPKRKTSISGCQANPKGKGKAPFQVVKEALRGKTVTFFGRWVEFWGTDSHESWASESENRRLQDAILELFGLPGVEGCRPQRLQEPLLLL